MNLPGRHGLLGGEGETGESSGEPPRDDYPPTEQSLTAARKLVGDARGNIKIIRRYATVGIALWRIEAKLAAKAGPDYELEIEGDTMDEVAYTLLEALQTVGFSLG